jgi:hypothetical protein
MAWHLMADNDALSAVLMLDAHRLIRDRPSAFGPRPLAYSYAA